MSSKIILCFILYGNAFMALSQNIEFSPFSNWHLKVNSEDIIAAGEDFAGIYETSANHMRIGVQVGAENYQNKMERRWVLEVERRNKGWHQDLVISTRRTGGGSGPRYGQAIEGGEIYREINRKPIRFFSCRGWRYDIPMQFELRGISVLLPVKTYSVELRFTIVED
ncbi:MAG: hypothetical protein HKN87_06425 [Saprospiraceae bacterium]|nr:hypothetical protein [Saprospiraceae bacterium]